MGNLIDELQRFRVLEDDFFFFTFPVLPLISFLVVLPTIDLELRIFHVLTQLDEKLGLIFEELEEFEIVSLSFEDSSVGRCLLSLVDLFDEGIYGLACLYGHIFILIEEVGIELVE